MCKTEKTQKADLTRMTTFKKAKLNFAGGLINIDISRVAAEYRIRF